MIDRLLRAGLILAVAGAGLQIAAHLVNVFAFDRRYGQLDASAEGTAFTWASSMATFAGGLAAFAWGALDLSVRTRAFLLGVLLTFFSLDDFVEVHERFGDELAERADLPEAVGVRIWILVYLPLLALATLLVWGISRQTLERIRGYQLAGLALLAVGVLSEGVGVLTKALEERGIESPHAVRAGVEEAVELAGWTLLAAALFAAAYACVVPGPQRQAPDPESRNPLPSTGSNRQS